MANNEALIELLPDEIKNMLERCPAGMMIVPFTNIDTLKELVFSLLGEVQRQETENQLIWVTKFPTDVMAEFSYFGSFNRGIAASCKLMYFDGHELLVMKLTQDMHLDTREIIVTSNKINGDGSEAFALWRLEVAIQRFRHEMELPRDSQWFRYGQNCKTSGSYDLPGRYSSSRQCELMIMPSHKPRDPEDDGFQPEDWPSVVFETGPRNAACNKYLQFGAKWWLSQSRGMVKAVFLLFFDRQNREILIEKWVRDCDDLGCVIDGSVRITKRDNEHTEVTDGELLLGLGEIINSTERTEEMKFEKRLLISLAHPL